MLGILKKIVINRDIYPVFSFCARAYLVLLTSHRREERSHKPQLKRRTHLWGRQTMAHERQLTDHLHK